MTTSNIILEEFTQATSFTHDDQSKIIDNILERHRDIDVNDLSVLTLFLNKDAAKHLKQLQTTHH